METGSNFDRHQHQQEAHIYGIEQKNPDYYYAHTGTSRVFSFFFSRDRRRRMCPEHHFGICCRIILLQERGSSFGRLPPPQGPRSRQVLLVLPPRLRSPFPSPSNTDPARDPPHIPTGKKRDKKCRFLFETITQEGGPPPPFPFSLYVGGGEHGDGEGNKIDEVRSFPRKRRKKDSFSKRPRSPFRKNAPSPSSSFFQGWVRYKAPIPPPSPPPKSPP